MPVNVRIPTPLRKLTGERETVPAAGASVQAVLDDLERQCPGLRERLYDDQGRLRRFINIYVNDEDIRFGQGPGTPVKDGDEIAIIPAIAGGGA